MSEVEKSAVISDDGLYRYKLTREASRGAAAVNFIMLNPSTADHAIDDPTIRRCLGFARSWGFDNLVVTNLFAWRATDPKNMKAADDPVGPENDRYLVEAATSAALVVCAWGNHGTTMNRSKIVQRLLSDAILPRRLHCISRSKAGHPGHPLYLRGNLEPILLENPGKLVTS